MRSSILNAGLLATGAAAFPAYMDALTGPLAGNALAKRQNAAAPQGVGALPAAPPPFDAAAQHVSTTGQYAFVAPGPTDSRGQCPGLNAMANHGYIPHNGFATIQQFIDGTAAAFGMATDLAGFLAIYGAAVDGDGSGWYIGGVPHTGIAGSHGNYEADSSPLKSDLNQYGSLERLIMPQFQELYAMQPDAATANYNLDILRQFRAKRFQESVSGNPYFTYNPFAGIEVSQAAFTFIYRFMANKSAEYPEGILDKATLKSFMSITGPENNLTWTFGHERFPDNFYKRNPTDFYSIPYFEADILYFAETFPETLSTGCNPGVVNSYDEVTPEAISNGAYTAKQVAANPICFASEFALAEIPLQTGLSAAVLAPLLANLTSILAPMNCAPMTVNQSALAFCPGLSAYGGPTGPIAPGAVAN